MAYNMEYGVDLVFCIDATASMRPILNTVKKNALSFYKDLKHRMEDEGKYIKQLRIRLVAFRDYLADSQPMLATDFFKLPEETDLFEAAVESIQPIGGGDNPEDGLEALAYAMKSDWDNSSFQLNRHVIVLWTDAGTHPLGYGRKAETYPKKMAKDFEELSEWWGYGLGAGSPKQVMNQRYKRLVLFAPEAESWSTITENWDQVAHQKTLADQGGQDVGYQMILDMLFNSIG